MQISSLVIQVASQLDQVHLHLCRRTQNLQQCTSPHRLKIKQSAQDPVSCRVKRSQDTKANLSVFRTGCSPTIWKTPDYPATLCLQSQPSYWLPRKDMYLQLKVTQWPSGKRTIFYSGWSTSTSHLPSFIPRLIYPSLLTAHIHGTASWARVTTVADARWAVWIWHWHPRRVVQPPRSTYPPPYPPPIHPPYHRQYADSSRDPTTMLQSQHTNVGHPNTIARGPGYYFSGTNHGALSCTKRVWYCGHGES